MITEILIVLGIILGLVLTGVLNRLRGTGLIKHFGTLHISKYSVKISLVWNHIFALYYGLIFGIVSGLWYVGLAIFVAYLVGEAKGWGEWIGTLTRIEPKDEKFIASVYKDDEGKTFPFIHQISNYFIKEQIEGTLEERCKQHEKYSILALALRGMYWFLPITLISIYCEMVSIIVGTVSLLLVSVAFPVACYIGKTIQFEKRFGKLHFSRGWENQEFIYGCFQFLFIIAPVLLGL